MKTITQVAEAMQEILGPISNEMAIETGFTERTSKVSGAVFIQAMVFSTLENPDWSYSNLVAAALNAGVEVTKQGLEQRFTAKSAEMTQRVLEIAVQKVIGTQPSALPLLERFNGVYIRDGSSIRLPDALNMVWPGAGVSAAVKLHVRLEVSSGQLGGPILVPARESDQKSPFQTEILPVGALRVGDLGFFDLGQFAEDTRNNIFWLTRYKANTRLYDLEGQPIHLLSWLRQQTDAQFARDVLVGKQHHLACRLLVERVPPDVSEQRKRKLREYCRKKQTPLTAELLALTQWTLILTNVPASCLSIPEAQVLLRVRWQIELLFKRWKSLFKIDEWNSTHVWRILTELFAKLLSVVVQHWILLTGIWHCPHPSFWKAALVVRKFATHLAVALPSLLTLERVLMLISHHFRVHCHLGIHHNRPSLYQLLERSERLPCIILA